MGNSKNADRLDSASLVKARQCRARGLPSPGFCAAGEKSPCRQARIDTQFVLRTMRIPPLAKFAAGASPLPYSAVRKRSVYSKNRGSSFASSVFFSYFLPLAPAHAAQHIYHITSFVPCKFAGYPNLFPSFYESSHLAKGLYRWYHKATTKE